MFSASAAARWKSTSTTLPTRLFRSAHAGESDGAAQRGSHFVVEDHEVRCTYCGLTSSAWAYDPEEGQIVRKEAV
jgi:hypothetical protein